MRMKLSLNIPMRVVLLGLLVSVVILAFGYRTEATGFTFGMGNSNNPLDLRIDSEAYWNGVAQGNSTWALKSLSRPHSEKFFNLDDVKPGDTGEATISLHVNKDAWICLDFEKLKEKENGRNEPEMAEDNSGGATQGELADGTEFFAWYDDGGPNPGDNIFQVGETPIFGTTTGKQAATKVFDNKTYALADSVAGAPFVASTTRFIAITWCAGDLTVDLLTAQIDCDGTAMGNEAQTDSFSVDISFRAAGKQGNDHFKCTKIGTTCEWPVHINVNNNATVINTTTSSSDTGGNSAGGGGTVTTGNASSTATTTNIINRVRIR